MLEKDGQTDEQTDGQTPDRYITLTGQRNKRMSTTTFDLLYRGICFAELIVARNMAHEISVQAMRAIG